VKDELLLSLCTPVHLFSGLFWRFRATTRDSKSLLVPHPLTFRSHTAQCHILLFEVWTRLSRKHLTNGLILIKNPSKILKETRRWHGLCLTVSWGHARHASFLKINRVFVNPKMLYFLLGKFDFVGFIFNRSLDQKLAQN
jgi:hypothetical protein